MGDESFIKRWRSTGDGTDDGSFGICLLCGIVRPELAADHGCVPNLPPEEMARAMQPSRSFDDDFFPPRTSVALPPRRLGVAASWKSVNARLEGLLRTLRNAPVGQRNTMLHWAACRVAEMLRDGDLPDAGIAADALATVGLEIGLDPGEVTKTITSAFKSCGVAA